MTPEAITDAVYAGMQGNSAARDWLLSSIRAALRERDAQVLKLAESAIEEQRIAWINAGEPAWALCASICKERLRALLGEAAQPAQWGCGKKHLGCHCAVCREALAQK